MAADPNRVQELFLKLIELPAADRLTALDRECGGISELRDRVAALLAARNEADTAFDSAGDRLHVTLIPDGNSSHAPECAEQPTIKGESSVAAPGQCAPTVEYRQHTEPGVVLAGPYTLVHKLGEGGMGEVWVARQTEPVKRKVALKLIKTGMDSKAVLQRFDQEREALALMDHPNIARVLDAGVTSGGQPFFAMELVDGLPLHKFCDELKFTPKQRLELFVPICQAVQHAHQKGIVHRDLKPANILITKIDGRPVPKVIDFGVAKATAGKLTDESLATQFGAVVGTLEYMAPEQAGFTGDDVDTRADIYSLGVILYELLTGLRPIDSKRLKQSALTEMIRIIREEDPSKPSTRLSTEDSLPSLAAVRQTEPRKLMALLRGELDWVVMKCLEKQRERRYETASALARDIQRYLANEVVEARPPSALYRMQKFVRKNRVGVSAGAAVLAALLAGLTLATYGFIRARADRDIADAAKIDAQKQQKIADYQKQLAIVNARKADENATDAKVQLANGLIAQADALGLAKRFFEAHQLYVDAYARFVELERPLVAAELGLWNSYPQTTFPLLSIPAHKTNVMSVAIAPDGRTALSGGIDSTVRRWELVSGKLLQTFTGHKSYVNSVAISPDGRLALSGSWDTTLKLWDLESGKLLRTFTGHKGGVASVAISADGRTALSGSDDRTLRLWDLSSSDQELRTFSGHTAGVWGVAISPDGQTALSASNDKTLKLWEISSGKEMGTLTGHTNRVTSVAFSPDGRTALSGSWDNSVRLWDLDSRKEIRTFSGHNPGVTSVAFAADGRTGLSGAGDNTMKLWDLAGGRELRTFTGHIDEVTGVSLSPDGRLALSASRDGTLKVWDLERGPELHSFTQHTDWVNCVALTPDGRTALSGSNDHTLKLWDLAGRKELRTFTGHTLGVRGVAIAPDGLTALSGSDDRTLKLWEVATGIELRTFTGHNGEIASVVISPDGRTALSSSRDRTLKLWDLESGKPLRTLNGHKGAVSSVVIAPDGLTALSGSDDRTLKLWDLDSGKEIRTFSGHAGTINSVAISPDGRSALSGCVDKTLRLWDLATGKELRTFAAAHTISVTSVAFGPEGRTALSGSWDHTLKLWDLDSGKEIRTFSGHSGAVFCGVMAPLRRFVLSGSADHTLKLWDLPSGLAQRAFEPRVAAAQTTLERAPNDAAALMTLGEWYAFRGMDSWAIEILGQARERGAAIAPLTLARCYWNLNHLDEAHRQFQIALEQCHDSAEERSLGWCLERIDSESGRSGEIQAEQEFFTAIQLARRGHLQEAGEGFRKVIANSPDKHSAWYDEGCLLAYLHDVEAYRHHCKTMLEKFGGSENPEIADRTAKTCLLLPEGGDAKFFVATSDRLLANAQDTQIRAWFNLLNALAKYRAGDDRGCLDSAQKCKDLGGGQYAPRAATADLLVAMASQRLGESDKARLALEAALERIQSDLPALSDEQPLTGMNLEDWLICQTLRREAEGLISGKENP